MGLDMYLSRRVHVSNYDHDEAGQKLAKAIMDALGVPADRQAQYRNGSFNIDMPEMYWRKANAIHGWFVANVQGGDDDCNEYDVSREELTELRQLCQDVLDGKQPKSALPPTAGFFFGDTEDDEYYRSDLKYTIEMINRTLAAPDYGNYGDRFVYRSSW